MKKKILLLSDDLRMTSGIATMSKEIVLGTIHKYDWVQLAAAINHPEYGKVIDVNDDVRKRTGIKDANLKIIPNNNYGNIFTLRALIKSEKPDLILHFTDPHYWQWLYDVEDEIRQNIPILYYHVWDNIPTPVYNSNYYASCDGIFCISKLTYGVVFNSIKSSINNEYLDIYTKDTVNKIKNKNEKLFVSYVPHGINPEIFKPVKKISETVKKLVPTINDHDFILFFNNRNIKRKQPSDIILSYKLFCDSLPKEKSDKCLLLMHTTPVDENGTDLTEVSKTLCPNYNIKFLDIKLEQDHLNELYNLSDCTINISSNEGFGLGTLESIMAGTPIIVNVTGGLQDQCGFEYDENDYINIGSLHDKKQYGTIKHGDWVVPVWPESYNLNGSVSTPYIFEDRVHVDEVSLAIKKVYNWSKKERKKRGLAGREWAMKNLSNKVMCDKMIEGIETIMNNWKHKKRFNLYKIV
jgi:glycosyltransferase involved in cell wall biosynthesis